MSALAPRSWIEIRAFWRDVGLSGYLSIGLLGALLIAWVVTIFPEWQSNPDLSHGFFTPLLFLLLIRESRNRGPQRYLPNRPAPWWLCGVVVAVSALVLIVASLFAAAMNWSHAVVHFLIGASVTGGLFAAWLVASSESARMIPLNWIAGVAILLWFLSLPIPPGTYFRLTLTMQLWITDRVLEALHLFGIPAIQNGNIIELARATVGVEEACSGVRSLISCVYAGFFFSAAFVQRVASRITLIVLAPVLAIMMNFVRSLSLTLLANAGIDIEGTWHDATGFAILGITALILGLLALGLEKIENRPAPSDAEAQHPSSPADVRPGTRILTLGYGFATAVLAFFLVLTRPPQSLETPAPEILSFLPASPEGWGTATSNGLTQFADILETDQLGQRTYVKQLSNGEILQVTFYLAYWSPGQARVSSVAAHTPDACWPGAGWEKLPTLESDVYLDLNNRDLAKAEYRFFEKENQSQHVWFWHTYDREVIPELNPRRPIELINSVLSQGVRLNGEQLFIRLSSNQPWHKFADEPLIAEIFRGLKSYGI
ncbi:MAG: hypothetical protein SynsKO_36750 [Synoicihabitans sp.]